MREDFHRAIVGHGDGSRPVLREALAFAGSGDTLIVWKRFQPLKMSMVG
jgi:DNA invertase Pin-like site-specific DNA recombinase